MDTPGDMPEHVTKCSTYLELVCGVCEMHLSQMMFALPYHSPAEELLTSHMEDLDLANGPAGTFGTNTVLVAPYTDHPIYEVVSALALLGDTEVK